MTTTRVTSFTYDWRGRRIATDGEVDFYEQTTYDNLDRVTKVERYDTTANGNLVARSETNYDARGRVCRRPPPARPGPQCPFRDPRRLPGRG
jgi:hypothetical protein